MKLKWHPIRGALALVVLGLLMVGLAACGGSSDSTGSSETSASTEAEPSTEAENEGEAESEEGEAEEGEAENTSSGTPAWCGEEETKLALAEGNGNNNWRKIVRGEAEKMASECPAVTEFTYTDGQGEVQKEISNIEGLTAQGYGAVVIFPDSGKALLPAVTKMYQAGVVTVPYRIELGGEEGVNYSHFISTSFKQAGELWGEWLLEALPKGGKVLNLGGPAGNSGGIEESEGLEAVLNSHPEFEFIGEQPFIPTDWEPAKVQQVLTASLAKYPQIDAITTDFGSAFASALPAFKQAGREVPALTTEDSNLLSCEQQKIGFPMFTTASQTWHVRRAVEFAVAEATGGQVPDSTVVPQKAFENSITGKPNPVTCKADLGPEAIDSTLLTDEEMAAALKR